MTRLLHDRRDALNVVRGVAVLLTLWIYRLGRCALVWVLLARWLGVLESSMLLLLIVVLRLAWVIRVAACVALIALWHWPWWAAILGAAPRLLLLLPGLARTYLVHPRHRRTRWPAPLLRGFD